MILRESYRFQSISALSNFAEAMKVTDFWNSLGNSLLITL